MVGAMILVGASVGLLLPGNLAAMSLATGAKAQGKVAGINAVAMGVGLVIGPIAGPRSIASHALPYWLACALLALLAAVVLLPAASGDAGTRCRFLPSSRPATP